MLPDLLVPVSELTVFVSPNTHYLPSSLSNALWNSTGQGLLFIICTCVFEWQNMQKAFKPLFAAGLISVVISGQ
jgi:hypothetical protein